MSGPPPVNTGQTSHGNRRAQARTSSVITDALLATRLHLFGDLRRPLAIAYFVQALGLATRLCSPTLPGFAIGSLLLGLPFTTITFFAMQEGRRLRPHGRWVSVRRQACSMR